MIWSPAQYNRFAAEREQPFWDLAGLLEATVAPEVVDLGCGDGRLTAALAGRLGASSTVGIDSSAEMLAQAEVHSRSGLVFQSGDLATWAGRADVVFANAALHWVPDHPAVLTRWRDGLGPGGQLAVQVPANAEHPSHVISAELGEEWLGADNPPEPVAANVLTPEAYAGLLDELGFVRQHVRLQVYGHRLGSSAEVVEWVKGTSLTRFRALLDPEAFDRFVDEYRRRLVARLGDRRPYFYPFKRILLWGRLEDRGDVA
ncbi:MAG: methyltransferase domain-containing protein [Acidimicrobiales bacterium]